MQIVILDSAEQIAEKSLEYLAGSRIAVSGGSTFMSLFEYWVPFIQEKVSAGEHMKFFPVDERSVPFEHSDSNWKVCYEKLLLPAGLGEQKSHHVTTALEYTELLENEFGANPIIFDSVFLGMGEDGHMASLFPNHISLNDTESMVIDVLDSPKPPARRVTLGLKPIRESRTLVTIVLGESKADMVKRLSEGDESLPITLVMKSHPNAVLLIDRAAASKL